MNKLVSEPNYQTFCNKTFLEKGNSYKNKQNKFKIEQGGVSRPINYRNQQDIHVSLLKWLCKTKRWKESKVMLHRYRQFFRSYKMRKRLCRSC